MKIVAISDLHGHFPVIPECDLLLVGGDICPDLFGGVPASEDPGRQRDWFLRKWVPWADAQPCSYVAMTWGNHDFCGGVFDYEDGIYHPSDKIGVYIDQKLKFSHEYEDGIKKSITIWMSPWSNQFMNWAFMKKPEELKAHYDLIPEGIDIIVSHQPPYGFNDYYYAPEKGGHAHIASIELLRRLFEVKPKHVVCGHLHRPGHDSVGWVEEDKNGIMEWHNVTVVNEGYNLVYPPTVIEIEGHDGEADYDEGASS